MAESSFQINSASTVVKDCDGDDSSTSGSGTASSCEAEACGGSSSIPGASVNMINSIIGVGIVTLPVIMLQSGVYFCLIMMAFAMSLIYYTAVLQIKGMQKGVGITTYGELVRQSMGNIGFYTLSFITFADLLGCQTVYCIIFRQLLTDVATDLQGSPFEYGYLILFVSSLLVILPLSMLKKFSSLVWSSMVSTASVFVIIIIIAVQSPQYHNAMVGMTQSKMEGIVAEPALQNDRAIWICNLAAKDISPYKDHVDWWQDAVLMDYEHVWKTLKDHSACKIPTDSGAVEAIVAEKGTKVTNTTLESSLQNAYAEYLFHRFSINERGAKKEDNFNLHAFIRNKAIISIGVLASTFICQATTFGLYRSLKKPSMSNFKKSLMGAFIPLYICCGGVALIGYFTSQYQSRNYIFSPMVPRYLGLPPDYPTTIARILLSFTIALTYPMQNFFTRINLILLLRAFWAKYGGSKTDESEIAKPESLTSDPHSSPMMFYATTLFIWATSTGLGMLFDNIVGLFGLIGAMFASPIIYIFPVLSWYGIQGGMIVTIKKAYNTGNRTTIFTDIILPVFVLFFGFSTAISSTGFTFADLINGDD